MPPKITDYQVIVATSVSSLNAYVSSGIADGWQPIYRAYCDHGFHYQTMVRYAESPGAVAQMTTGERNIDPSL